MKYFVTIQGREYEVDLTDDAAGATTATIADQSYHVGLHEIERLRRYSLLLNDSSYDVMVEFQGGRTQVHVSGYAVDAAVEDDRQHSARQLTGGGQTGPVTVTSMMPGVLRDVRVREGQTVNAGDALVILEAMKMENEIRAEGPGVVAKVAVEVGQAVESGAVLVVLESLEADG